jgi:muconolactone delta-isomerase
VEFLVEMTTHVPGGTSEAAVQEMRTRESDRAVELSSEGALLRLWRPPLQPGEWRTYGLFAAPDADALEKALTSMPLHVWRTDTVTPLAHHSNDPLGRPDTIPSAPGTEYFTWFTFNLPDDIDPDVRTNAEAGEALRTAELATEGQLLRLWMRPGNGLALGLWSAADTDELQAALDSLPLINWLAVAVTPLTVHPSDPATT